MVLTILLAMLGVYCKQNGDLFGRVEERTDNGLATVTFASPRHKVLSFCVGSARH